MLCPRMYHRLYVSVSYESRVCVRHRLPLPEHDLEGTIGVELGGGRGDVQGV